MPKSLEQQIEEAVLKGDAPLSGFVLRALLRLAKRWKRETGNPGGASVYRESFDQGADHAKRTCAKELENMIWLLLKRPV